MENHAFLTKAIRYQKTATDSAFALLSLVQSNSDDLLKKTLEHCNWLPDYGKKGCLYWSDNYLKSTKNIKSFIDQGYEEAEKLFKSPQEEVKKSSVKTKEEKTPPPKGTKKASSKPSSSPSPKPSLSAKSKSSPKSSAPQKSVSSSAKKTDNIKDPGINKTEAVKAQPKDKQSTPTNSTQPKSK